MFISIKQVRSNLKNEFQVDIKGKNGDITYTALTPWLGMNLPFNLENLRKMYFNDACGNIIYSTRYDYIENTLEENIPFKFAFAGKQKFSQMSIFDADNIECGKFYTEINGWADSKICVLYGNEEFLGYNYAHGSTSHISFYKGSTQVAQIIKTLGVIDNLDEYYLFVLDEYDYLNAILSFLVIYIDYWQYRNAGELSKGRYEISREYTFSKNNKYYNPRWIPDNFGEDELLEIHRRAEEKEKIIKEKIKMAFTILGIVFGGILILGIILYINIGKVL